MNDLYKQQLFRMLKEHEGFVPHAYYDSLGYITIGYGRLIDKRKGGGISKFEAHELLDNDVRETMRSLDEHIPWWRSLDDPRQVAVVDMAFNLGVTGLMGFHNMLMALEQGQCEMAAREALNSLWAKQVGSRANEIAKILVDGRID